MELLLFEQDKFRRLYNCSRIDVDSVPLAQRQNVALGIFYAGIGLLEELLYIPCMFSIWRHREFSCYKIMFVMGALDMGCLLICGIATGWLTATGAVYCSAPTLIYGMGIAINGFWPIESSVEVLLAVDRCVEVCRYGTKYFKGNRTWLLMVPLFVYGFVMMMYVPAFAFSAVYSTWFFSPYVGYIDEEQLEYSSTLHDIHDWMIAILLPGIYLILGFYFYLFNRGKSQLPNQARDAHASSQTMILLQVTLISVINAVTGVLYVYLAYSTLNPFLAVFAQFIWIQAHGIPPIIYLAMNRTIRHDCAEMLAALLRCDFNGRRRVQATVQTLHSVQLPAPVSVNVSPMAQRRTNHHATLNGGRAAEQQQHPQMCNNNNSNVVAMDVFPRANNPNPAFKHSHWVAPWR